VLYCSTSIKNKKARTGAKVEVFEKLRFKIEKSRILRTKLLRQKLTFVDHLSKMYKSMTRRQKEKVNLKNFVSL